MSDGPQFRGICFRSWWQLAHHVALTGRSPGQITRLLNHYGKDAERVLRHCGKKQVLVGGQLYPSRKAFLRVVARTTNVPLRTLEYWSTQGIPLAQIVGRATSRARSQ